MSTPTHEQMSQIRLAANELVADVVEHLVAEAIELEVPAGLDRDHFVHSVVVAALVSGIALKHCQFYERSADEQTPGNVAVLLVADIASTRKAQETPEAELEAEVSTKH